MTALWIGGAALVLVLALFVGWRLDRAAHTVERILADERERPALDDDRDPEPPGQPAPAGDPGDDQR
ncbi:MAG: hypothetical protein ACJ72N_20160 [Labedaea sp.]